jgi:predicted MFS family arabinose efflux permease
VLGVPLGLWLAEKFEWHAPFFLLAGLSVVIFSLGAGTLPRLRAHHAPAHPWRQMKAILANAVHQRGFAMSAALVFAGSLVIPFLAPSMVANVGLPESQLPLIYFAGGICTFVSMPLVGRWSDRHDKLHVLGWLSLAASVAVLLLTNLPRVSVPFAMLAMALFMVTMSGRYAPAMAMITNAVEARYRGGFMSVNAAVQQAFGGLANVVAGVLVTGDSNGRLAGYPRTGVVAVACFWLTFYLGARLRAAAPEAARPGHLNGAVPVAAVD